MRARKLSPLLVAMALFVSACASFAASGEDLLAEIESVDDLQTHFNEDQGSPRLILLLSPT